MRLSHSSYKKYLEKIKPEICGESFHSPLLLNNRTLVFPFVEKKHQVFVISLNNKTPIAFITESDLFFSSFENSFLQRFRKHIGKSIINSFELKDNDLILEISLKSIDEFDTFKLIVELIPNKPNLIVMDEDNRIKDFYYKEKNRTLKIDETYEAPKNSDFNDSGIEISDEFLREIFVKEFEIREKEKFASFEKYINSKIKGAEKRIIAINDDVKKAEDLAKYRGFADEIISSAADLKAHLKSIVLSEQTIELDESKTLLENAQYFYKKAKKAKETISRSKINIENAKQEMQEYQNIYDSFKKGNEHEKEKIASIYSNDKKKKETVQTIVNRPWKVNLNGTIIYFGRNASQNDYLSFVMKLDREFTWLHIKDKSGAHLVIANKKPTENELLTACEISLLCSRSTAGEVSYTKKKNVRRGHVLGEAILKNHSTIKLNSIRKETISLFESAVRC